MTISRRQFSAGLSASVALPALIGSAYVFGVPAGDRGIDFGYHRIFAYFLKAIGAEDHVRLQPRGLEHPGKSHELKFEIIRRSSA